MTKIAKMTQNFAEEQSLKHQQAHQSVAQVQSTNDASISNCWEELKHVREHLARQEDAQRLTEDRMKRECAMLQSKLEDTIHRLELRFDQIQAQISAQDAHWHEVNVAQDLVKAQVHQLELSTKERLAREIEQMKDTMVKQRQGTQDQIHDVQLKHTKQHGTLSQQHQVDLAKISCQMEEQLDEVKANVTQLQIQLTQQHSQYQQSARQHQDQQKFLTQNIISLQQHYPEDTRTTTVDNSVNPRLQTLLSNLEARQSVTEHSLDTLAKDSIQRAEVQSQKILRAFADIEQHMKYQEEVETPQALIRVKQELETQLRQVVQRMESLELEFKNARNNDTRDREFPNHETTHFMESNIRSEVFQQAQELRMSLESKLETSIRKHVEPLVQDLRRVQTKVSELSHSTTTPRNTTNTKTSESPLGSIASSILAMPYEYNPISVRKHLIYSNVFLSRILNILTWFQN